MATGASTCDLAVILVDARKGILDQTRRHSFHFKPIGLETFCCRNQQDGFGGLLTSALRRNS